MNCPPGFVKKEHFVQFLRDKGFKFKRQAPQVDVWRRGMDIVQVPRKDLLPELHVIAQLKGKMCRCAEEEIAKFLRDSHC